MKKFILSLFLSIIGFIGFSNAYELGTNYEIKCEGGDCNSVTINSNSLGIKIIGGEYSNCRGLTLTLSNYDDVRVRPIPQGQYIFTNNNVRFITLDCAVSVNGNLKFVTLIPDKPIIEGGSSNITPVITGLFGVYGELIPYVVYIGIGILLVTIGFYAIRRLVNWLSDKIHNNFKF